MKSIFFLFLVLTACAMGTSGCVSSSTLAKNPWAPPEKKKSMAERWDEEMKKSAATKKAENPVVVTVAKSQEVAEVVFADIAKKMVVAYRLGGAHVPVMKGDIFALRGKDTVLNGVARLDIIDGDTLGFVLVAGTTRTGDLAAIPGDKLLEEMEAKFPPNPAVELKK